MPKYNKIYYVYIVTNKYDKVLYVGVTNSLARRIYEHRNKLVKGFTSRYNVSKLVYFEDTYYVQQAIAREKEIKGWLRKKKLELIRSFNSDFRDLYEQIIQ